MKREKAKFLLSINWYYKYPKLLSVNSFYYDFCVPWSHYYLKHQAAEKMEITDKYLAYIDSAFKNNIVLPLGEKIYNDDIAESAMFKEIEGLKLTSYDELLLKVAVEMLDNNPETIIVIGFDNINSSLVEFCKKYELKVIPEKDIPAISEYSFSVDLSSDNNHSVKIYKKHIWKKYGVILTILYVLIFLMFYQVMTFSEFHLAGKSHLQNICIQGLILLIGFSIYLVREFNRTYYGVMEILVGIISINAVLKQIDLNLSLLKSNSLSTIAILGGLYIIVRGLDNVVKGQAETIFLKKIKRLFGIGK